MMKIKVSAATGIQLDWMVATIERLDVYAPAYAETPWLAIRTDTGIYRCPSFTTDWAQGGPIIYRERIGLREPHEVKDQWYARITTDVTVFMQPGPTPLIAAMRCFCCSKLGDIVDIPEELCQQQNS